MMNLHVLRIICCSIGAISLMSSMPALGSLASTSCNGILGGDDPILSSCTNTNIYDVYGAPGITLSQTGTANVDIKSGQLSATAIGDRYFSIGYAGTGSGLLRDDIIVQGQGSNWSATIQMTMKIDGLVTGPLQNRPNIVAQAYLTGSPGDNSANINVSWDGTGFTTDTSTSVGNFSVNVIASGTNNYSVVLTNAFEVSELSPTFRFYAYLKAIGGSNNDWNACIRFWKYCTTGHNPPCRVYLYFRFRSISVRRSPPCLAADVLVTIIARLKYFRFVTRMYERF